MNFQSSAFASQGGVQSPNNIVKMGCTMLAGTNKKGILRPDKDGYYTTVMGAYSIKNSAGMFYDGPSGEAMFRPDSPLMRRIKKGVQFAEFKHPEPFEIIYVQGQAAKRPMTDSEYLNRIRKIDDDRVCAHIRNAWIEDGVDENGQPVKRVLAEIKPYGPFEKVLRDSLDNPSINTYFSVRSITQDDVMRGIKYTREISTWDFVGEGGILIANKYQSPALEDFQESERIITPTVLWKMQDKVNHNNRIGLESSDAMDVSQLITDLGWERSKPARRPHYLR